MLPLALAAANLLKELWPVIQADIKAGKVSPEDQLLLAKEMDSLRNLADNQFNEGPEWTPSTSEK